MERFEEAIFKQREEIKERMTEMFSLLIELTKSKSLEKLIENDKGTDGDAVVDKNIVEPIELVDKEKVMDEQTDNESNGSVNEDLTR
ncbi:hypothetical protein Tco_1084231 [Tanacetum coccineum]